MIAFACQWLAWARIDRATFQYHYYTSVPFLLLALAYFLAELWHGAVETDVVAGPAVGRRGDRRARALWVAPAAAVRLRPGRAVNPGSQACLTQSPTSC